MNKKHDNNKLNPGELKWYFGSQLVEDPAFQGYVGYYGAYLTLIDSTNNNSIKEYYIMEACNQFAMLKCRCLTDGVYYAYYANDEKLFISHIINLYNELEILLTNMKCEKYIDIVRKMNSEEGISYLMQGGVMSYNHKDPLLNVTLYQSLLKTAISGFKAMIHIKEQARIVEISNNAVKRLIETGLSREDAEKVMKMIAERKDIDSIESYVNECYEKSELENDMINIDPVIEEINVDDLLKDWGLQ